MNFEGLAYEFKADTPLSQPEKFRLMGEMFYLLSLSPEHVGYSVAQVAELVVEPIRRGQFRLYSRRSSPVGLVTWGLLDAAAAARFESGQTLRPDELQSGNQLWILDFITPFGDAKAIADDLARGAFAGYREAYAVKRYQDGRVRRVKAFRRPRQAS
jgi:cytolysin-activating lysine-acyltransferase